MRNLLISKARQQESFYKAMQSNSAKARSDESRQNIQFVRAVRAAKPDMKVQFS